MRINGNMSRVTVAPVSCLWCSEIHHRAAPGWRESQPAIPAAQGQVQMGNIMLPLTTLQKEKFLWCLVTEFNHFQSVIMVQIMPGLCCEEGAQVEFLAYALKTKLKTAHLYRPLITYLIVTSTVPYSDKGIFNWYQ